MIRSIVYLLVIGLVGIAVLSVVFGALLPLILLTIKVAIILALGYFVLRIVSPKKANEVRDRLRRVK